MIMCKVFDKSKNETYNIDLKEFLVKYRMLKKTQQVLTLTIIYFIIHKNIFLIFLTLFLLPLTSF